MSYELHVLDLDVEDDEAARDVANSLYVQLQDAGHDVEGVAVVRPEDREGSR